MSGHGAAMTAVALRPRRAADIPALVDVLREQQPTSRYPFRDPLPIPVERFFHTDDAVGAWTAELDGRPVGHVCHTGPPDGFPGAAEMNRVCALAHGCEVEQLAWISTLFVALELRGRGVGRRLLSTAVDDIRRAGLRPCLEVLPVHPAALALYTSTGWRKVMQVRPEWLVSVMGDEGPDVTVMVHAGPT